ncbi:MAG: hypothetical protein PWR12_883 [Eubacteriaceae bacterium]|nr:hypothetical protein [Eubacteriaceae bacterium]MDK2904807.1 hypothetical protein [Eubacteriaceae bacterium]MDK2935401.1 hypothetical protein [Eubacteriaceae bacterium]MDK2962380.1 hypothetical protein [Eubacteriaceae bacterium]
MSQTPKELELSDQEKNLFKKLDRAIDQMEAGQVIDLYESIDSIRKKLFLTSQ